MFPCNKVTNSSDGGGIWHCVVCCSNDGPRTAWWKVQPVWRKVRTALTGPHGRARSCACYSLQTASINTEAALVQSVATATVRPQEPVSRLMCVVLRTGDRWVQAKQANWLEPVLTSFCCPLLSEVKQIIRQAGFVNLKLNMFLRKLYICIEAIFYNRFRAKFFGGFSLKKHNNPSGVTQKYQKKMFFGQKPAFLEPSKISWNFTWKSNNFKIGSKSVNFGPILLWKDSLEGESKILEGPVC